MELEQRRLDENLAGRRMTTECTLYRVHVFKAAMRANMSMGMLNKFKTVLALKGPLDMNIGCAHDLMRTVGSAVIDTEVRLLKETFSDCYPQFGTIIPGRERAEFTSGGEV